MQAAQVVVETERQSSKSDVLVRAVASGSRMNDGRPVAGFMFRRRYHGDIFAIKDAKEFSPNWMEFVDGTPEKWLPVIKKRYPDYSPDVRKYTEKLADENRPMSMDAQTAKISSGEFDYSNGSPKRKKLNLE